MKRKNILKEAGVLLVAAILVLTAIVTVTMAQLPLPLSEGFEISVPPPGWSGTGSNPFY